MRLSLISVFHSDSYGSSRSGFGMTPWATGFPSPRPDTSESSARPVARSGPRRLSPPQPATSSQVSCQFSTCLFKRIEARSATARIGGSLAALRCGNGRPETEKRADGHTGPLHASWGDIETARLPSSEIPGPQRLAGPTDEPIRTAEDRTIVDVTAEVVLPDDSAHPRGATRPSAAPHPPIRRSLREFSHNREERNPHPIRRTHPWLRHEDCPSSPDARQVRLSRGAPSGTDDSTPGDVNSAARQVALWSRNT